MIDYTILIRDLTDQERLMFQDEFNSRRKDSTIAALLTVFLGGLGAHKFYLGKPGVGILYLAFCWTFIPVIVSLVEISLMRKRVREHNSDIAAEIVSGIKALRSG